MFASSDTYLYWPLATLGADDLGEGYSESNGDVSVRVSEAHLVGGGQGLPTGSYKLVAEARYPSSGCQSPGWYQGRSLPSVGLTVGPEPLGLEAVAPGQVVDGGSFRVYSGSFTAGETAYVFIASDWQHPEDGVVYEGTAQPGGFVPVTLEQGRLPAGLYYVAVGEESDGSDRSTWRPILSIEPPETQVPLEGQVGGEEDTSCGGEGTECVHGILPGQSVFGSWDEAGDRDYFGFVAGAGTRIRVTLDRTDLTLPPQHPDAPAPELLLLRPDGVCSAASEPLGLEATGTSVETTLSMSGAQVIVARTPKGSGQYRVHLDLLEEGGTGESVLGYVPSPVNLVTPAEGSRLLSAPLLDPFGEPLSGQQVEWQRWDPCGEEGELARPGARSPSRAHGTVTPGSTRRSTTASTAGRWWRACRRGRPASGRVSTARPPSLGRRRRSPSSRCSGMPPSTATP